MGLLMSDEVAGGPPLGSRHYCQRRLLHSLALSSRWHHCDIGIARSAAFLSSYPVVVPTGDQGALSSETPRCYVPTPRPPQESRGPQSSGQSGWFVSTRRLHVSGQGTPFMSFWFSRCWWLYCFILFYSWTPGPAHLATLQVLHIWWPRREPETVLSAQLTSPPPRLCLLISFFYL